MQKGFATLEIILAIMIIAVLTKFAVPNAVRLVDRAALDYETKRLYSELSFVKAIGKLSTILDTGTGNTKIITSSGDKTVLVIDTLNGSYQAFRGTTFNKKAIREPHYLENGITISFKSSVPQDMITFNRLGNATDIANKALSNTLILTSRLKQKKHIVFDSVGRIRGSLTDD